MRLLGVHALYQRPRTSQPHPAHRIYPYLLRDLPITRPNHVWCTDVTYIPLRRGFLSLVAVMDWASRTGLSWRLSNTLEASFCVEALHEARERNGPPEIFNSDQGSQFTSVDFTDVLTEAGIRISMDGKGRWMDNVFIERLWRSLKYECVYLSEFATGSQSWQEGVALVLEVAEVFERSGKRSVPRYESLVLTPGGAVEFLRGRTQSGHAVSALARTLNSLLPSDRPTQLRLLVSTAGPDTSAYQSVAEFVEALKYFERPGRRNVLSRIHERALTAPLRAEK